MPHQVPCTCSAPVIKFKCFLHWHKEKLIFHPVHNVVPFQRALHNDLRPKLVFLNAERAFLQPARLLRVDLRGLDRACKRSNSVILRQFPPPTERAAPVEARSHGDAA